MQKVVKHDKKELIFLICLTLGLFLIDLLTKWIMVWNQASFGGINAGKEIAIIPNFILVTLITNNGTIFGIGSNSVAARIILIIIRGLIAIIAPIVYYYKGKDLKKRYKVLIAFIYAGCIGNLVDSAFYWQGTVGFSGVVDWIKFSFFPYIFNIADSYVTVSIFLLIIFIIIDEVKEIKERNKHGEFSMTPEEYEKKLIEENRLKNTNKETKINNENSNK